jgi:citrate lyase subunit beta / citryl-CoA lyase
MVAKARTLPADEVFIDLEDAVAPAQKTDDTRRLAAAAILQDGWSAATLAIRVNAVTTEWCLRDVEVVVEHAGAKLDCLVVPKVESASELHFLDHLLDSLERAHGLERRIGLEVQIESARGLVEIEPIATATDRNEALVFGPGDYATSLGIPQSTIGGSSGEYPGDQWHYPLARIVTTARAFGLQAIDGPYAAISDREGFVAASRRALLLGYDGKWVVHPDQIAPCNEAFTPSQEQFDSALHVLDVYERAVAEGAGAAASDGTMIDEASRKQALSVTARGRAAGLRPPSGSTHG